MSSNIPCQYFKKEGFCIKGKYCEFLHEKVYTICTYFFSDEGCRYGDSCTFAHFRKNSKNIVREKMKDCGNSKITDKVDSSNDTVLNVSSEMSKVHFEEVDDDNGVYFFGAASDQLKRKVALESYKSKVSVDVANVAITEVCQPVSQKKKVCQFFLSGNCRFGVTCRLLHIPGSDNDSSTFSIKESNTTIPFECGVCLTSSPKNNICGLLSGCLCTFCVECIRDWRSTISTDSKGKTHIRLCPLCRRESYFVVPVQLSSFPKSSEEQNVLTSAFKENLSQIWCKYEKNGGDCPFGTSCFYKHDNVSSARVILNNNGDAVQVNQPASSLLQYIRIK